MTTDDKRALLEFAEWFMRKQRRNTRRWKTPEEQEAHECPNAHDVAVFLSIHAPDLPPVPATVATSSQSGEERQAAPDDPLAFAVVPEGSIQEKARITPDGQVTLYPGRTAPHVKVTEVVGLVIPPNGVSAYNGEALQGDSSTRALVLNDLIPDEGKWPVPSLGLKRGPYVHGPRGRFRITVEFWPEEVKKLPDDDDPYWDRRRR